MALLRWLIIVVYMTLQNVFYVLAILWMSISLLMLIGIVALLLFIKNKIATAHDNIMHKIASFTHSATVVNDVAAGVGAAVAATTAKRIRKFMNRKS